MIIRLVTMSFHEENIPTFLAVFDEFKEQIRAAKGCLDLQLIQNTNIPNEISTLSKWDSEESLNNYRGSDVFKTVWPRTKKLFNAKPKATSFTPLIHIE